MPPPTPRTATFVCHVEEVEKAQVWVDKRQAAEWFNRLTWWHFDRVMTLINEGSQSCLSNKIDCNYEKK